ncbi:MAG TPA: hypothetical protein VK666_08365 [Chryseolinea sp.]|nr:hypothetical protein [Chryseolinea sp.]
MVFQDKKIEIPFPLKDVRTYILIIFGCVVISFPSRAQDVKYSSYASLAEKIYLQLDSKVYTTDQTIWFKAIIANARDHTPTNLSGVLHVELIDPNEKIVERKLIRLERGIGDGFFQLNQGYAGGPYLVRAYTEWDRNFGSDFFFKEYIQVFPSSAKVKPNPIRNVTLVQGQNNERRLNVTFDPFAIDSLHAKDLTLFISLDEKSDTLSIKKDGTNKYRLDYAVPPDCRFITLQVQTKNYFSYSKTIVLEKDYLDLQFFPESGELVQGIPTLLGFKALDSSGKGKLVEGDIINREGKVVASFKSNRLGMGSVVLDNVDSSEKYMARIISREKLQRMYALPAIAPKGNVLSVKEDGNKIHLEISSNYLIDDSVFIQVSCRGVVYYDVKGRLRNGRLSFSLFSNALPEGIIDLTLMDASMSPVAERLYFNERPGSRINISVSRDKESYTQREQTRLTIETKDTAGQFLPASLSLLVLNKSQQGQSQDARQNILSYFLLNADLRGEIENPGFYFGKGEDRHDDLDALLLTQGWRKYKYTREPNNMLLQPEVNLTVSGIVKGGLFNRKEKKGVGLTMMTFGEHPTVQAQAADSLGRFSFVLDEYGQDLNILIQSENKSGVKKNYSIALDKKEPPPVVFDHIKSVEEPDSVVQAYVKKSIERKKAEDAFTAATEGITLGEVVVKSYFMTPERKLVADKYGKPKTIIEGDAIREKEAKWSYGLYSVILFNFPDKVKMTRSRDGVLYASLYNSEPTLVVIDGIAVKAVDYGLIPSIPPSEVKSFELIEYANNFRSLYCEAVPDNCGVGAPVTGNVIAIYTYGGKGLFGANAAVGIMKTAVPVFAAPREFYAPKYEQLKPDDWLKPDLRTLIHWEPNVQVDSLGKGSAVFYNADNTGTMQVIVEGISQNGQVGYKELFFDIRKR